MRSFESSRFRKRTARSSKKAYGPDEDWVALFRTALGYLGTELLRDDAIAGHYVTIDRWDKSENIKAFKQVSDVAYGALNRKFEKVTASETKIGAFNVPALAL